MPAISKHPALPWALAAALGLSACTTWKPTRVYGEPVETGRRAMGEPQVVDARRVFGLPGFEDAPRGEVCAQRVAITTTRPYTETAEAGRTGDIVGSSILMGVGLSILIPSLVIDANDGTIDGADGDLVTSGNTTVGGAAVLGGALWLGLSYALLPSGPRPAPTERSEDTTALALVPAVGCVSAEPPPTATSPPSSDVPARLRELERLRDAGVITEDEYQDARRRILDAL